MINKGIVKTLLIIPLPAQISSHIARCRSTPGRMFQPSKAIASVLSGTNMKEHAGANNTIDWMRVQMEANCCGKPLQSPRDCVRPGVSILDTMYRTQSKRPFVLKFCA